MSDSICSFPDCGRALKAKGLCAQHYRQHRLGRQVRAIEPRQRRDGVCAQEECVRPISRRGLCEFHYRNRDPEDGDPICACPGCDSISIAHGLCENHRRLVHRYGMTVDQIAVFFSNAECEICGGGTGIRDFSVDHDHACCPTTPTCGNCNRGLLCGRCNSALGYFRDDLTLILAAAAYLERYADV